MPKIAISYRRGDSAQIAGRIRDRLTGKYGTNSIFMDIHNIPLGIKFPEHIQKVWSDIDVLLVLIGPKWLRHRELTWPARALRYLVLPTFLLLIAHYVIVNGLDLDTIYLRAASFLVPLPFGVASQLDARAKPNVVFGFGAALGVVATVAMTVSASLRYHQPIIPLDMFEWLENIEYIVTIALGFWTGNLLGRLPGVASRFPKQEDWVEVEVATALNDGVPVIPVLLDGATMPSPEQLPKSMRGIAYHNATEVRSGTDFDFHMNRLMTGIDDTLAPAASQPPR